MRLNPTVPFNPPPRALPRKWPGTYEEMERAIKERTAELQLITDSLPALIAHLDRDCRYRFANRAYERWFGIGPPSIIGVHVSQVIGAEAFQAFLPHIQRALSGERVSFEAEAPFPGRTRQIHADYVPALSDQGEVDGFYSMVEDIGERKILEAARRDRERHLARVQEVARLGSWELEIRDRANPENNPLHWSDECFRIFGFEPAEVKPTNDLFFQMVPESERAAVMEALRNAIETGQEYRSEHRIRWGNGQERWLEERALVERGPDGRALRLLGTTLDITDRKQAENKLVQQAEELWRSNQALEQFAYISSHDLKEPLRQIASYAQLLEADYRDRLDGNANKYLTKISASVQRMNNLIQDLLTFSKIDQAPQMRESVDLNVITSQVLADLDAAIQEKRASVSVDSLPTVLGVPSQMHQLLQNLLSNAIKFNKPGESPEVHITAKSQGAFVRVCVTDNGIGIDRRYHARIFKVFQRLHGRQSYPGTGIGLAICKKIVEQHGGKIWVESSPGHGSRFCCLLPSPRFSLH